MALNYISFSLSLILNLLLFLSLILGISLSPQKKEEVKINFLEPKSIQIPSFSQPNNPLPEQVNPPQGLKEGTQGEVKPAEIKKTLPKREINKGKATEKEILQDIDGEKLLQRRLAALSQKNKIEENKVSEEESSFLKERLASLQGSRTQNRVSSSSSLPPSPLKTDKSSEEYLLLIKRKLQTHFEVPIYLKNKGNLSALVEIEVNSSGEITRITFLKRAEDQTFNRAVEKCLEAVNPLPIDKKLVLKIEFKSQGVSKVF